MADVLTLGIPKGSLQEATLALFARAGFSFYGSERTLWLGSSDPHVRPVMLRPQEIPVYVADGSLDCGLSGWDWIKETNCEAGIRVLADLCYSKRSFRPVRWVLAVAEESAWRTVRDLKVASAAKRLRVSTELKATTESAPFAGVLPAHPKVAEFVESVWPAQMQRAFNGEITSAQMMQAFADHFAKK